MLAVAQARERVRPVSTDTGFDLKHNSRQVQRDIWRLGRWERERLERHRRASSGAA